MPSLNIAMPRREEAGPSAAEPHAQLALLAPLPPSGLPTDNEEKLFIL